MKKYIIVSIIVAALFVGGSIGVAKALTAVNQAKATTLALTTFTSNLAKGLITLGFVKDGVSQISLDNAVRFLSLENSNMTTITNGTYVPTDPVYAPYGNCFRSTFGAPGANQAYSPAPLQFSSCMGWHVERHYSSF